MTQAIAIAPLTTQEHYHTCEQLQQAIWGSGPVEVVPAHLLITFQRHGGMVLGAFDPAGQMIGFAFGFLGQTAPDNALAAHRSWQHCSHELGVVRAWRGQGVGYQLKLAQRDWVLRQGLDLVTWTYDPLEMANATLNIGKLGTLCRCYLCNLYGTMPDALNASLPSDRFEVSWQLASAHVTQRLTEGWRRPRLEALVAAGAVVVNPARAEASGVIRPGPLHQVEAERLCIEVPASFQAVKRQDLGLALAWRLHTREAFEACFAAGYSVCDVVTAEAGPLQRAYYLLEKINGAA